MLEVRLKTADKGAILSVHKSRPLDELTQALVGF